MLQPLNHSRLIAARRATRAHHMFQAYAWYVTQTDRESAFWYALVDWRINQRFFTYQLI